MAKQRRRNVGVAAFTDENDDDLEVDSQEDDAEESEEPMAKETAKAKARKAAEAEAAAEEEEEDDDEEITDDAEDEEEVDEEEDDDEDEDSSGFTPWIYHTEADWSLSDAFTNVDKGDPIIIYDVDNDVWYKLAPIKVGELPAEEATA